VAAASGLEIVLNLLVQVFEPGRRFYI